MTRTASLATVSALRPNLLAGLIGVAALGFLTVSYRPIPAACGRMSIVAGGQSFPGITAPAQAETRTGGKPIAGGAAGSIVAPRPETGQSPLAFHVALLESALARLERVPSYTGTLYKQEQIDGEDVGEVAKIFMKVRHEPFSVYMKWLDDGGQEVLYVDGQNNGKMLVRAGGWQAMLPIIKLDPSGSLAMKAARHPITKAGLLNLVRTLLDYRHRDLKLSAGVTVARLDDVVFEQRQCYQFTIVYDASAVEPVYRKTIVYCDQATALPLYVKCFTWPDETVTTTEADALDEATLLEFYGFADLNLATGLSDRDFDQANSSYSFRR